MPSRAESRAATFTPSPTPYKVVDVAWETEGNDTDGYVVYRHTTTYRVADPNQFTVDGEDGQTPDPVTHHTTSLPRRHDTAAAALNATKDIAVTLPPKKRSGAT